MRINEKLVKALKFIGAAAAFAVSIPFVSANASVVAREAGDFTISAIDSLTEGTDYSYENNVLTIKSDKAITIENTDRSAPTADRIVIDIGAAANITLAGVNIETNTGAALEIAEDNYKTNKITLADGTTNTLKTTKGGCAGLQKNERTSFLDIEAQQNGTGKLIAQGGENAAGIGGSNMHSTMHIRIYGGIINATGGKNGAGIGGGYKGNCDYLKIKNGTVIATGGSGAAGIGGGNSGSCKYIYIHGGNVTANGGDYAAGIGGGSGGEGSNIEINGGTVTANGGQLGGGAGIGGGNGGTGSQITVTNGKVNATGGEAGAGIGGGGSATGSNITISGGTVTAKGNYGAAGIGGGGNKGGAKDIIISGGSVKAIPSSGANAIGSGSSATSSLPPTNGSGKNVFLYEIENPNAADITIDGKAYPLTHGADIKIYAYLSEGETHTIKLGYMTTYVKYNNGKFEVVTAPTPPSRADRPDRSPSLWIIR